MVGIDMIPDKNIYFPFFMHSLRTSKLFIELEHVPDVSIPSF